IKKRLEPRYAARPASNTAHGKFDAAARIYNLASHLPYTLLSPSARGAMQEAEANKILARSRELFRNRDFARSAEGYRTVLRYFPRHANAHVMLARISEAQGKLPEAIDSFNSALKLDPNLPSALHDLGVLLVRMSQPRRAIPVLEKL